MNMRNRITGLVTNNRETLWDRLIVVLKQDPKTQVEMAKEIGISLSAYQYFINGLRVSNIKTLSKIEKYVVRREKELNGL